MLAMRHGVKDSQRAIWYMKLIQEVLQILAIDLSHQDLAFPSDPGTLFFSVLQRLTQSDGLVSFLVELKSLVVIGSLVRQLPLLI